MKNFTIKFALGCALGNIGKSLSEVESLYSNLCARAVRNLSETPHSKEGFGWLSLPDTDIAPIKDMSQRLRGYDSIVQVGIGGSALGNLMLNQALLDEYQNEIPRADGGPPKFYMADNPDPSKTRSIWERVKDGTVALIGVSKSGATAETMAQFLWLREELQKRKNPKSSDKDILVITDPNSGVFREFANASGCCVLDLPSSVGGRYSVLSSAGLTSAAALGIDVEELLRGASSMREIVTSRKGILKNPACAMAMLHVLHESAGRPMSVLMPYSSKLASFAEWFAQLWGESLGKDGFGTTPVRALGAIDQHSQVQLYTQGPDDKFFTIINVTDRGSKITVPKVKDESLSPLSYMSSFDMGEMLSLEAMSTAAALAKAGRPVVWIEVEKINAPTVGALVFFYEYMTALTGGIMKINPFDQPGVEQGKRYTYGLMGRGGYEAEAEEAKRWFEVIEEKKIKVSG